MLYVIFMIWLLSCDSCLIKLTVFLLCVFKGNVLVKNVIYRQYKIFLSCFNETLHVKSNSGIELSAIRFVFLAVRLIMQKLTRGEA